jgi:hypothetical protein
MRDHPRPNHDWPVVDKPEKMKYPDEKEDGARDDQVQLVAHFITPFYRPTLIILIRIICQMPLRVQSMSPAIGFPLTIAGQAP